MKALQVSVVDVTLLAYLGHGELLVQLYDKNNLIYGKLDCMERHGKIAEIKIRNNVDLT